MKNKKILIVEDDSTNRTMYELKLKTFNYTLAVAINGQDGLEVAKKFLPDIILLDLKMPGMNGDEMLELLRREKWGANIRVIILTNLSRNEAPHKLRLLNVDRYIVKAHSTPLEIAKVVEDVLS